MVGQRVYGDGLLDVGAAAELVHRVAQAGQLGEADKALDRLQANVALTSALQNQLEAVEVLVPELGPDQDVVEVDEADDPLAARPGRSATS